VFLEKTILRNVKILVRKCLLERRFSRLKVSFTKTILKRVHISNKHHKSHVWPKNLKKCILAGIWKREGSRYEKENKNEINKKIK
jgi:hypothetical protein